MNPALILIDIQNDYFKGGKSELAHPEEALHKALTALHAFREKKLPIFHVRHINPSEDAAFFAKNSVGSEIRGELTPKDNEPIIIKCRPSMFFETDLHSRLQHLGVSHLIVCGMMSHMCIDTSVRAAKDLGYDITVLEDACTTKDLIWKGIPIPAATVHAAIMASLSGVFARVIDTEKYLKG